MRKLFILLILFSFSHSSFASDIISILPKPNELTVINNNKIDPSTISNWVVFSKSFPKSKKHLDTLLNDIQSNKRSNSSHSQIIVLLKNSSLLPEQYKLSIKKDIVIEASTEQGAFYALQSLKQLFLSDQLYHLEINDNPANIWRANMIDVARHFRSIDYLKRHIELMAYYKMNRLHLHLSDDQGFRIEIKAFPKLTQISGKTSVYNDPAGYYTQEQMKELIDFAKEFHVQIIPEIDIPAHTRSITHAYPELACDGDDTSSYSGTRVLKTKLCLQKMDIVLPFLKQVFTEILEVFESKYIHIGADEVLFTKGLEVQEEIQLNRLYQNIIDLINSKDKTVIAWEEILNFDLKGNMIAQIWNNKQSVIQRAKTKQIPVILSICQYAYFDHGYFLGQEKMTTWCNKNGVTLKDAYSMPVFKQLDVIGIESALWGEFVRNDERADKRLWPRLLATSESSWSFADQLNFNDFKQRVEMQLPFLHSQGVQYFTNY